MQHLIRNFCIIAHIDHGKSTLADRLLEITGTVDKRIMKAQFLDQMELERERGITIKLQPVRMKYTVHDTEYILNLIDTPGHVDFSYEVSRSLQACEGALLLVDATQGIQAQTLAHLYLALEHNLEIIPIVNKIDLPAAQPQKVSEELIKILGCALDDILYASGKTGQGVPKILEAVIDRVPAPKGNLEAPLRALIFDSMYDDFRGVITYVRVVDGQVHTQDLIRYMASATMTHALEVGHFKPQLASQKILQAGEIGYIVAGMKQLDTARVGDTVTLQQYFQGKETCRVQALSGYRQIKPMVYASIFCKDGSDYDALREAMGKLKLNDASLMFEPENSKALGFGFRCGFLGLLHLEIIQERLRREFDLDLIVTAPSVAYNIFTNNGDTQQIHSPLELPDPSSIEKIEEPWVKLDIITPKTYLGGIMQLVNKKGGRPTGQGIEYINEQRVILHYEIPLAAIVVDFYDALKNVSSGYASMNYELSHYETADVIRLDILVAGERVEPLASIVYRKEAYYAGRKIVAALKDILPRQVFEVRLQAALGSKIIASERIAPLRKDVTAKLYGGDVTRKRKLLEKQKRGKKRLRAQGKVDIPQEAFFAVLKKE
ncbi:MAG: elongation factor 4 [Candidatus Kerfeldbacteria bacterium RIFCSPHIGHO2_02_FULL_42_14]|uniref:Elongation factor 4 n=1 Tax=Candidatus Kerfeldbacteria bacterium RIFCSPHIGHO2_02_FULL_42_14 TaxID=1798540 RepID=A0A1G2AP52_9BACT|nr:MAG: elongation factor 4 [Candidatus Kerfeldbacteria bacterium RIFCSPHIGHO2_02_FULL_42_14]OGY81058.1 MAG: elongation factor 4 [Candidatus Kerfeldbacteria bacterium RIFCSPHIGHO2_12_FULL_42_13]OGY84876.1 MAG: elongation factor 4 [Candidatus Kerfeldbacteria bacterium RIFCSPLOWO2_02_FULL_42_19]